MKKLIGLLGWLGVALVLAAVVIRFVKPEWQPWYQGLALAGLVVTLLYAATQWRDIARTFQGRNVKYGSLTVGSVLVFVGLLIGINYITNRQNKRWDLTAAKQFSLSDQTKKLLSDLKKPVVAKVFYDSSPDAGSQKKEMDDHLNAYAYQSKMFTVDFVDAVRNPTDAKAAGIDAVPTTVFSYDGRTERTTGRTEQDFTNALKKVVEGVAKKAYFIQGHGEHDIDSSDRSGYSGAIAALKSDNFDTAKLPLVQEGKVPDDATVVIVAGPTRDYLAPEIDALKAYLKKGGKLLLMIDPPLTMNDPPLTNLIALAKDWGVTVGNDYVLDRSGMGQLFGAGPQVPIAVQYPSHPITTGMNGMMTAYQLARSATPIDGGSNGHTAQPVVQTGRNSWAESDIKSLLVDKKAEFDASKGDKQGPITLVSAVSASAADAPAGPTPDAPKPETRVVVAGDSDFASNGVLGFQGNRDFFANTINWLAQQENLISIRPRDAEDRRLQITADQGTRIFWLTFVIIPALLFANGIRVWWKRR